VSNRSKAENLLDHLFGTGGQGSWDSEAEPLVALKMMVSPYFVGACIGESADPNDAIDSETKRVPVADFVTGIRLP
jgi:hypothetical protein